MFSICENMILQNPSIIYTHPVFHVQPEDGHCQTPKRVVVPYVVILDIPIPSNKVVLDKYIRSTVVSL